VKPDIVFKCRKCEHYLFVDKKKPKRIYSVNKVSCPNCGEEGDLNWIYVGEGNFEKLEGMA